MISHYRIISATSLSGLLCKSKPWHTTLNTCDTKKNKTFETDRKHILSRIEAIEQTMEQRNWENGCSTPNISPEIHTALLLTGVFHCHVKQTFISWKTDRPWGAVDKSGINSVGCVLFCGADAFGWEVAMWQTSPTYFKVFMTGRGVDPTLGFLTFAQAKLGFIFSFLLFLCALNGVCSPKIAQNL